MNMQICFDPQSPRKCAFVQKMNQETNCVLVEQKLRWEVISNILLNGSRSGNEQLPAMPNSTSSKGNCHISKIPILRAQ